MGEPEDLLWKSRVEDYLVWLSFPATRRQVIDRMVRFGLPPSDIYAAILALPERVYHSPEEVVEHMRLQPNYCEQLDMQGRQDAKT